MQERTAPGGAPGCRYIAVLRVRGKVEDVAVTARTEQNGISRVRLELAGNEIPADDAARNAVDYDEVELEANDFLIIPSEEITTYVNGKIPVHVNATNLQQFIEPPKAATVMETMQQSVVAIMKQREETGVSMFPHINHPNFGWAITVDDMIALKGERFFEV